MTLRCFRATLLAAGFAAAAATASAQTTPPIKPGLWELQTERETDGKKAPDMGDRLNNLPPAQRAQIEAMMKQRGVALSSDGSGATIRVCLSADALARGGWQGMGERGEKGANERCKTEVTERGRSTWKWHAACTDPDVVSDGEASFASSEQYTIKLTNLTTSDGVPRTTRVAVNARWLANGCDDVKAAPAKRE